MDLFSWKGNKMARKHPRVGFVNIEPPIDPPEELTEEEEEELEDMRWDMADWAYEDARDSE